MLTRPRSFTHAKRVCSPIRPEGDPRAPEKDAFMQYLSTTTAKSRPIDSSIQEEDSNSLLDAEGETDDETTVEHIPPPLSSTVMSVATVCNLIYSSVDLNVPLTNGQKSRQTGANDPVASSSGRARATQGSSSSGRRSALVTNYQVSF